MAKRTYAETAFWDLSKHPMPSKVEVSAIRATYRGSATEAQQKLCFRYILELLGTGQVTDPRWSPTELAAATSLQSAANLISALANRSVTEIDEEEDEPRDRPT